MFDMERKKSREKLGPSVILLLILHLFIFVIPSAAEEEGGVLLAGPSLRLTGYTQVRYTYSDEDTDGFGIRRARVGLRGEIFKNINYRLQVDGAKRAILVDAAVEIGLVPHIKLTFGQFKVPFSLENLTSSGALDTINRSQTVEILCPGRDIGAQGRDIGMAISGRMSRVELTLGVFNGSGINTRDFNDKKDVVGRIVFSPAELLTFGFTHYKGLYSPSAFAPSVNRDRTGVDMFLDHGRTSVKAEYIFARDDQAKRNGWYVQGGFHIIPEKIQSIIKYDSYDRDLDTQGERIKIVTIGLSWFFSKKIKLQINYEYHKDDLTEISENAILTQFQAGF